MFDMVLNKSYIKGKYWKKYILKIAYPSITLVFEKTSTERLKFAFSSKKYSSI